MKSRHSCVSMKSLQALLEPCFSCVLFSDRLTRLFHDQMENIYYPVIVAAIYVILYWIDYALAYSFCKVRAVPCCSSREPESSRARPGSNMLDIVLSRSIFLVQV